MIPDPGDLSRRFMSVTSFLLERCPEIASEGVVCEAALLAGDWLAELLEAILEAFQLLNEVKCVKSSDENLLSACVTLSEALCTLDKEVLIWLLLTGWVSTVLI